MLLISMKFLGEILTVLSKDKIYFDTDTLSSFLCVEREDILISLFNNRIMLTGLVETELFKVPPLRKGTQSFKDKILFYRKKGLFLKETMQLYSSEFMFYQLLTENYINKRPIIGNGEASVIAFAKVNEATMASSNLKDVASYTRI